MTNIGAGVQEPMEMREPPAPRALAHIVADPAPLGLAAFAMTTFALSISNTNVWGAASNTAIARALVYGGAAQLLAGMWEFVRKNTFGALAFTSYGAFWLSYVVLAKVILPTVKATQVPVVVGVFLLCWTIFTFYMLIGSTGVNVALVAVFLVLEITFVLLTIGAFNSNATLTKAAGWTGVITAALAWYASSAGLLNETLKRTLLPTWPLAKH